MKKSANYWMVGGFDGVVPVAQAAKTAKDLGYDAIEFCFGAGELTPGTSEAELARLRMDVERTGIEIASFATGGYWGKALSSPDEAERGEAVAFTEAYLKAAHAFGTDTVLVIPGTVDVPWDSSRPVVPAKKAAEMAQRSIQSLLPLAEKLKVVLALENVWSKFLTGPFEMASFIDAFDSPFVKSYFDAGNCLINGYSEHWIEILGTRIQRVHMKNFTRDGGGGTLANFTGSLLEGDANWPAIFPALKAIGYNGFLTAEVIVGDMPNIEQSGRVCLEMKQLIERYA